MQISITARHFDLTQALKDRAEGQLEKLSKYGIDLHEAHAVLSVEKYRHKAEITLRGQGVHLTGSAESDDMYTSVDQSVGKLEEQIRRHKEKARDHKARSGKPVMMGVIGAPPETGAEGARKVDVIRSDEMIIPTLTVEEAILEMDQNGDEYLLFTNSVTDKVNILTRREDGNYGMVET